MTSSTCIVSYRSGALLVPGINANAACSNGVWQNAPCGIQKHVALAFSIMGNNGKLGLTLRTYGLYKQEEGGIMNNLPG